MTDRTLKSIVQNRFGARFIQQYVSLYSNLYTSKVYFKNNLTLHSLLISVKGVVKLAEMVNSIGK